MKDYSEINEKVQQTLDAAESIKQVSVSPFFKENVMHKIRNASEEIQEETWSWFTPKLQLATLIGVIVLNMMAFSNLQETSYESNINSFAESYGLSSSSETLSLID